MNTNTNQPLNEEAKKLSFNDITLTIKTPVHQSGTVTLGLRGMKASSPTLNLSSDTLLPEQVQDIGLEMIERWNEHKAWINIKDSTPKLEFEEQSDEFMGMVSQSVEVSDGHNLARGHYQSDGKWIIYSAEHDFMIVDPSEVTHYKSLPTPPSHIKGF